LHSSTAANGVVSAAQHAYLLRREGERKRFAMLHKLIGMFHMPTTAERELRYLNGSVDRYDLEYRQRQIDRGMFRTSYSQQVAQF
jgi:hypothetical protein